MTSKEAAQVGQPGSYCLSPTNPAAQCRPRDQALPENPSRLLWLSARCMRGSLVQTDSIPGTI